MLFPFLPMAFIVMENVASPGYGRFDGGGVRRYQVAL
jgi:hypothetical protein